MQVNSVKRLIQNSYLSTIFLKLTLTFPFKNFIPYTKPMSDSVLYALVISGWLQFLLPSVAATIGKHFYSVQKKGQGNKGKGTKNELHSSSSP